MNIVTKKGDSGTTGLASGKKVSKTDPRIEAVGTLDELVSFLGLARASCTDKTIAGHIKNIQRELFLLGTEIVSERKSIAGRQTLVGKGPRLKSGVQRKNICQTHLKKIEKLISKFEPALRKQRGFIIPGGNKQSAFIDVARTICRRLERRVVELKEAGILKNEAALKFTNRLSDLLYIFARSL